VLIHAVVISPSRAARRRASGRRNGGTRPTLSASTRAAKTGAYRASPRSAVWNGPPRYVVSCLREVKLLLCNFGHKFGQRNGGDESLLCTGSQYCQWPRYHMFLN